MDESDDLLTIYPHRERFTSLMQKYVTPLDHIVLAQDTLLGDGRATYTYAIAGKPHVLKVLFNPEHISGKKLLNLETFEQNALALEQLATKSHTQYKRWPALIARGTFKGKPAQIETNLAYHPGSIVGIKLDDYLKKLRMDKRFGFYRSVLVYLWLQDTHDVVTYDVQSSNLGIYGHPVETSLQVSDPDTATIIDFGTSWVTGSPYNAVTRQEAYDICRADFLSLIKFREMAAGTYWLAQEQLDAKDDLVGRERSFNRKHQGKLETIETWKNEPLDTEQLMRKFTDLFFEKRGNTYVFPDTSAAG